MDIRTSLVSGFLSFFQNTIGIVSRPYETYRRITQRENMWELPYIAILLAVYFALVSLVKTAAFRPFLLSKQFVFIGSSVGFTYILTVVLLFKTAQLVGGTGSLKKIAMGWAYTMLPTLFWFLSTSLLYVILPPPRTESTAGILFSVCFLLFSSVLFFWKFLLGYLVLRFGMRLSVKQILAVIAIDMPILVLYSILMYAVGIFRVPFI